MLKSRFLVPIVATFLFAHAAEAAEVRIYNWSDYIDEDLLKKFETETGIDVIYDVYDSNQILETKLLAGKSGYDVVVPTGDFLLRQISAGVFRPLDWNKIPNSKTLWDVILKQSDDYDPGNRYSVNYMWGTTGIGVNTNKVREVLGSDAPVDSIALLLDPENMKKLAACGVYVLDSPDEVFPAVLNYLGEDPNARDLETIRKAEPVLAAVRPYIKKFENSEYITALANGDICVAFGFSGDILQARDRAVEAGNGVEIAYNAVREGSRLWFDQMAIPADASNPDAAHAFINFIIDPENIAVASNYIYFANGVHPETQKLNENVIGDKAIYPDDATMSNLYTTMPWSPKVMRGVNRIWTKLKSGT